MNDQPGIPKQEIPSEFMDWISEEFENQKGMIIKDADFFVFQLACEQSYHHLHSQPSSPVGDTNFDKMMAERKKCLDMDIADEIYAKMRDIPRPGSSIKIIWQGEALDGVTDEGYVFQLPFCDEQHDSLDFFVHIPDPDNSSGIGDAPQEFVHLLSLVNNPLVKEIFEVPF